ncbi:MAG TPA: hypothetical protein VFP23_00360 [Solirubrobacterales bacterium]|nr:hypothetical protein [Solirubrobacterales bacterium]
MAQTLRLDAAAVLNLRVAGVLEQRVALQLLVSDAGAARVAIVDSLSLGIAAVAPRERAEAQFAAIFRESLEAEPGRG